MTTQAADDDVLTARELLQVEGGTWGGLLFDNPRIGLPPALTWSFRFPFQEVSRDYGSSPVFLDVDWLSLPVPGWRNMAGQTVRDIGEPAEASVYFFSHHQYDLIDLEIVEQRERAVHARAALRGDVDRLGIDRVVADAWLTFSGITVHLSDTTSAEAALARLRNFTDTAGLSWSPTPGSPSFQFVPTGS
ncbi:hypothetical protein MRQ36_15070 [Micromonospora sp. R77]|uniref:hypothetical protein n=1 Tax=Micromonospora sp. R77 TaxID=2925836 RepID=UPI001F6065AF|nr:hypothetical protein [Micromonospora sp. R77]MCI4063834.1 hypothetical protein [Micromonospora sp. R77]